MWSKPMMPSVLQAARHGLLRLAARLHFYKSRRLLRFCFRCQRLRDSRARMREGFGLCTASSRKVVHWMRGCPIGKVRHGPALPSSAKMIDSIGLSSPHMDAKLSIVPPLTTPRYAL